MIDPDFHIRRALQQYRHESEVRRQQQLQEQHQIPVDHVEAVEIETSFDRIEKGMSLLISGFAIGGMSGFVIGSVYAFKTKYKNPFALGLGSGVTIGLLFAQYAGFRYIVPEGLNRQYSRWFAGQEVDESSPESFGSTWKELARAPGLGLPDFILDMTPRQTEIAGSALAGGLSGYITTRAKAFESAVAHHVSTGSVGSRGVRGALFWSAFFALGQHLMHRTDDYRRAVFARKHLKSLYEQGDDQALRRLVDEGQNVPERTTILPYSWAELMSRPRLLIEKFSLDLTFLPFIHSQQDFEYREYLESKYRLLDEEVQLLRRLETKRLKQIEVCNSNLQKQIQLEVDKLKVDDERKQQQHQ